MNTTISAPKKRNAFLRAQAMVEFMLVLPILLLLLYGTIEVARLIFIYTSVSNASRQAARYGATNGQENGIARYQDCEGIREAAMRSAFIVDFDSINITYDRGVNPDGTQNPIAGVNPDPNFDSCPIDEYDVRNGDRIIVRISVYYEPIVTILPFEPLEIVSTSARTFIVSIPILGSAVPTGFSAETSTPSRTPSEPSATFTETVAFTKTITPIGGYHPTAIVPTSSLVPSTPPTPSNTPLPTYTATITPTLINCSGLTGVSHGPLVTQDDFMEMSIQNNTGYSLSTAMVYVEWNHDSGHAGSDPTLTLLQAFLDDDFWSGSEFAPSLYLPGFYPIIPPGKSVIRFIFHQTYDVTDGTERILIVISTPGCVNYPIDSRK